LTLSKLNLLLKQYSSFDILIYRWVLGRKII